MSHYGNLPSLLKRPHNELKTEEAQIQKWIRDDNFQALGRFLAELQARVRDLEVRCTGNRKEV